jgi:hypothetical protein
MSLRHCGSKKNDEKKLKSFINVDSINKRLKSTGLADLLSTSCGHPGDTRWCMLLSTAKNAVRKCQGKTKGIGNKSRTSASVRRCLHLCIAFSKAKLWSSDDKESCFRPFWIGYAWDKCNHADFTVSSVWLFKPSGNYMSHLLQQLITLFMCFVWFSL